MKRFARLAAAALIVTGGLPLDAAQTPQDTGVISGFGYADGKPVRNTTARLRKIETGELVTVVAANGGSGTFGFIHVPAGTYVVELLCNDAVLIGTSAPVTIGPASTASRGVVVDINAAAASAAGAAACVAPLSTANGLMKSMRQPFTSALGIAVVGAAAASGVTAIVSTKNDTSASR